MSDWSNWVICNLYKILNLTSLNISLVFSKWYNVHNPWLPFHTLILLYMILLWSNYYDLMILVFLYFFFLETSKPSSSYWRDLLQDISIASSGSHVSYLIFQKDLLYLLLYDHYLNINHCFGLLTGTFWMRGGLPSLRVFVNRQISEK